MTGIRNKRVTFDYEILDKYTAGIELFGFEVKSVKSGHGSLLGSYIKIREDGAFLVGANIPPFQPKNAPEDYDPIRPRRLLLRKKELKEIAKKLETASLTVVPISMYNKGRYIKLDLATARGRKKFDKREAIKKRDTERDLGRSLKN